MRRNWLYKKLASIKTSAWLLGILCAFFLIGTIFPQGKGYAEEGGALLKVFELIDVLNIFTAPLFLIVAALLFVNQLICSYERLRLLLRMSASSINAEVLREDPKTLSLPLPPADELSERALAQGLTGLGFRVRRGRLLGSAGTCSLEKGVNPHWASWIFHTGILVLLAGFAVSYLFAFEGELSLLPGEREEVSTRSSEARWYRLRGEEVKPDAGNTFSVGLEEFITEYTQFPRLSYPPRGAGRLALFTDLKGERIAYTMPEGSLFPRDWMSRLTVHEKGRIVKRKTIEVNDPLRHSGVTFYQMDIGQQLTLAVSGSGETLEVKTGEPFEVPGIEGKLRTGMLRVGTLYKKVGTEEKIVPYAELKLIEEDEKGEETKRSVGRLVEGEPLTVQGVTLTLAKWREASILSYRYDPGRPLLWVASIVLLAAMTFRIWAYWYRLEYLITGTDNNRKVYLRVMHSGLLADGERMIQKIGSAI